MTVLEFGGYEIDIDTETDIEKRRADNFDNESRFMEDLLDEFREDDVFWDIGANIGIYSLFAANIIKSGEIHSFEPHPSNILKLLNNVHRDDSGLIFVHNIALHDSSGTVRFDPVSGETGEGHGHISTSGEMLVECRRGDQLDINPPDVIKIDVEGAEMRVLNGLFGLLGGARAVYIEAHPQRMMNRYDDSVGDIIDLVKRRGMTTRTLMVRGREKFMKLEQR